LIMYSKFVKIHLIGQMKLNIKISTVTIALIVLTVSVTGDMLVTRLCSLIG